MFATKFKPLKMTRVRLNANPGNPQYNSGPSYSLSVDLDAEADGVWSKLFEEERGKVDFNIPGFLTNFSMAMSSVYMTINDPAKSYDTLDRLDRLIEHVNGLAAEATATRNKEIVAWQKRGVESVAPAIESIAKFCRERSIKYDKQDATAVMNGE